MHNMPTKYWRGVGCSFEDIPFGIQWSRFLQPTSPPPTLCLPICLPYGFRRTIHLRAVSPHSSSVWHCWLNRMADSEMSASVVVVIFACKLQLVASDWFVHWVHSGMYIYYSLFRPPPSQFCLGITHIPEPCCKFIVCSLTFFFKCLASYIT